MNPSVFMVTLLCRHPKPKANMFAISPTAQ
jgi:hypothetical protein